MAKKKTSRKRASTPTAENKVRRITHRVIMENVEGDAVYRVYGLAKKAIVQDTPYGSIPALKGSFEAVKPDDSTVVSSRCFLPPELHAAVAAKMQEAPDAKSIAFLAEVTASGDAVKAAFLFEPSPSDPMAFLRERAQA